MRKLLLIEAAAIGRSNLSADELKWPASRSAFLAFEANVTRTARLIEVPAFAAVTAEAHSRAAYKICRGEPNSQLLDSIPDFGKRMQRQMAAQINIEPGAMVDWMQAATRNLDNFIQSVPTSRSIFESFLNAILIHAWAALETLARQLLQECVEQHSWCFSSLAAEDVAKIQAGNFQKLETIRSFYKVAFGDEATILNRLKEQCIDGLYLIRNLLVHKAGIVDHQFRQRAQEGGFTAWAELAEKSSFPTTGIVVRDLVDPNMKCGYGLISAVDRWLSANAPKA